MPTAQQFDVDKHVTPNNHSFPFAFGELTIAHEFPFQCSIKPFFEPSNPKPTAQQSKAEAQATALKMLSVRAQVFGEVTIDQPVPEGVFVLALDIIPTANAR